MGFSVSGAAAVIFLSMFIAFGMLYTAADNSFHEIVSAQDERTDGTLEVKNTAIELSSATYEENDIAEGGQLVLTANNTGATGLSLQSMSLLIDNTLQEEWEEDAAIDGVENQETDLWLPGETLTITLSFDEPPERVTLATGSGVSVTAEVTA